MVSPVLKFKRGLLSNLPLLNEGEPGFTTDYYELYVGSADGNKLIGSGRYWNKETSSSGGSVKVFEATSNGTNFVGLAASTNVPSSITFTLPNTDGSSGDVLVTDGSGNLSFSPSSSSSFTISGDSGSNDTFNTGGTLTFSGSSNEIITTITNNRVEIGLRDTVNITTELDVPTIEVSNIEAKDGSSSITIANSTGSVSIADSLSVSGNTILDSVTATSYSGDGAGITSVDADQLDGQEGTYYLDYNNFTNTPTIPTNNNQLINGSGYITTSFTNTNQLTNGAGFITASDDITGTAAGLSGNPSISVNVITASSAEFSNNVSIGGTLTYEDVSNVDSVGLITARTGIDVLAGGINAVGVVTATTFDGSLATTDLTGTITNAQLAGSIENSKLSNSTVSYGGVQLSLGGSDATPAFDLSDATNYPYSSLTGITTNIIGDTTPQLGGNLDVNNNDITGTGNVNLTGVVTATTFSGSGASLTNIPNSSLDNSSISYGGVSLSLGGSDATPAFDLSDATNYPTSSLSGTIANAQLAGSIENSKLSNSTVSYGGVQLSLGGSDATPAFDLSDATNYPYSSLTGITTNIVGDTTPQLGGNLDVNGNDITGTGDINLTGIATATSFSGSGVNLTGIVTSITAGNNISISGATGNVTITGLAATANINADTVDTGSLSVTGITTLAGNTNISGNITSNVTIVSTDTGSSAAPEFTLYRNSASPAPGDYLGQIMFKGENSNGGQENYAKITAKISDETLGTEDGLIETAIKGDGSFTIVSRQRSDELQLINGVGLDVDGTSTFGNNVTVNADISNTGTAIFGSSSGVGTVSVGVGATALLVEGDTRITGILTVGTSSLTLDGSDETIQVGSALTLGHSIGLQFHTQSIHVGGFEALNINSSGIVTATTFSGNLPTTDLTGTITNAQLAGSIENSKLSNSTVSYGGIQLSLGGSDATPAFDLSDATNYPTSSLSGTITNAQLAGSIENSKLSNSTVSYGGIQLSLGGSDATPAFDLSDATNYPTSSLSGTITNAQLAGSIENSKLSNSTVSYGGVELSLGGSDTTPAFDLSDATNYPTSSLSGTITNAQLAGSIANGKLANSTVSYGGVELSLGGSDTTPAFDLSDATNYPYTSLTGITTDIVGDTTPQLGGNLDVNGNNIIGTGNINITGDISATTVSIAGTLTYEDVTNVDSVGLITARSGVDVTGNITVTGTVDGRDVATDGTKLDGIESGATADQTASEILTLIKTVDGTGSGLDADTLDGIQGASFLRSDQNDTMGGVLTISNSVPQIVFDESDVSTAARLVLSGSYFYIQAGDAGQDTVASSGDIRITGYNGADINSLTVRDGGAYNTIWHAGNDGTGSGLDADTLDGIQGASFLRSDANDSTSGSLSVGGLFSNTAGAKIEIQNGTDGGNSKGIYFWTSTDTNWVHYMGQSGAGKAADGGTACTSIDGRTSHHIRYRVNDTTSQGHLWENSNDECLMSLTADTGRLYVRGDIYAGNSTSNKVWHAGNDGSGSGLDADTVDGIQGASFLRSDASDTATGFINFNAGASSYKPATSWTSWFYGVSNVGQLYTAGSYWVSLTCNGYRNSSGTWTSHNANSNTGASEIDLTPNGYIYFRTDSTKANGSATTPSIRAQIDPNGVMTFGPNAGWSKYLKIGNNANNSDANSASIGVTNGNLHIDAAAGSYATYLNFYDGTNGVAFGGGASAAVAWMGPDGDLWKGSSDNSGSKYWHAGNDGSGSGLDADTLDGAQPSVTAGNNTIVKRHSSGYIFANYFNTTPNDVTSGVTRICCETGNDGYIRHATTDAVRGFIGAGSGNGLDADTVDGYHSYQGNIRDARADGDVTPTNFTDKAFDFRFTDDIAGSTRTWDSVLTLKGWSGSTYRAWQLMGNASTSGDTDTNLYFREGLGSSWGSLQKVWTSGNDGSGSGLDADTLDGVDSGSFLRSDAGDTFDGSVSGRYLQYLCVAGRTFNSTSGNLSPLEIKQNTANADAAMTFHIGGDYAAYFGLDGTTNDLFLGGWSKGAAKYKIWHAANDGSGSGLDADTVDGIQGSALAPIASPTFTGDLTIPGAIKHTGDTNTYIQFHGNDLFRVVIAGAEVQEWGNNYTLLNDNDTLRLGSGSDFRMYFSGADTVFRNYAHANGDIIFQGETSAGANQNILIMKTDSTRTYNILYENNSERLRTVSTGVNITGALTATGDVTAFSDITLKEDIEVIPNALDKVSQIRGVTFTRKDLDDKSRKSGVIAQEVEEVLPEVVTTNEDGIKTVAYGNLVGLLIESIKELKAEVEELKKERN